MQNDHPISALMLFTLVAGIVIIAAALLWHLRKRSNRKPMAGQRHRDIDEIRRDGPTS